MNGPYDDEDLTIVDDTEGIPPVAEPEDEIFSDAAPPDVLDPMDDDW
jgi:hypothetical protein